MASSAKSFISMPIAPVTIVPINTAHPTDHPVRLLFSFEKMPETHSVNSLMISLKKKRTVAAIVAT